LRALLDDRRGMNLIAGIGGQSFLVVVNSANRRAANPMESLASAQLAAPEFTACRPASHPSDPSPTVNLSRAACRVAGMTKDREPD
jgi:hypothetical protein